MLKCSGLSKPSRTACNSRAVRFFFNRVLILLNTSFSFLFFFLIKGWNWKEGRHADLGLLRRDDCMGAEAGGAWGWGRCLTGFGVLANTLLSGGLGSGSENRGWPPQWPGEEKGSRNHRLGINGDRHFHTATRIPTATSPPRHLLNKRAPESVVAGSWNPSWTQELCWVVTCTAGFHTREGRATQPAVRKGGSAPSRLNFLESPKLSLSS